MKYQKLILLAPVYRLLSLTSLSMKFVTLLSNSKTSLEYKIIITYLYSKENFAKE